MADSSNSIVSVAASGNAAAAGGSVIDVNSLVSQLVSATRAPQDARIAKQTNAVSVRISAVGTLKSALSAFQSALAPLRTASSFAAYTAGSSDAAVATAIADVGAVPGSYRVTVAALATAQQLLSGPIAGGSKAVVGTGTLSVQLGDTAFDVVIDARSSTLAGIAAAINSAADNPGVTAAVIQGTDGAHLLLSSAQTGAENTIQVTETGAGGGLAALAYGPGNTVNYTQVIAAQDAAFSVAGVADTSASNTVTDAVSGLTLNLTGISSTPASIVVRSDVSTVTANIKAFVDAYNALQKSAAALGGYDSASGVAGPMLGDTLLTGIQGQIDRAIHSLAGTTGFTSLASIGVTTQKDGSLAVDDTRLQAALASGFSQISELFTGEDGIATRLNQTLTAQLSVGGLVDSRSDMLIKQKATMSDQADALDKQMAALTSSLTQQYSALNALLSTLRTTSAYLSQAIDSLPTVQGKKN